MFKIFLLLIVPIQVFAMDGNFKIEYESFKKAAIESKTLSKKQMHRLKTVKIVEAKGEYLVPEYVALCIDSDNTVYVNIDLFINQSYFFRQKTIDHELGHCVLNRSHFNETTTIVGGMEFPESTMYFKILAYASDEDMAIKRKELFDKKYYGSFSTMKKRTNGGAMMDFNALRKIERDIAIDYQNKGNK